LLTWLAKAQKPKYLILLILLVVSTAFAIKGWPGPRIYFVFQPPENTFVLNLAKRLAEIVFFGLITGVYTGLIVSRIARFAELRAESLRIIRSINYIQEPIGLAIWNDSDVSRLGLIASELLFLKHNKAAKLMLTVEGSIINEKLNAGSGQIGFTEYNQSMKDWQSTLRNLPMNLLVLFAPWGHI